MRTLFPLYFSSSILEDLHGCQLAWYRKHCQKLDMGEKSHHLIAGALIASALEITRKEFYENNSSQEDSVEKGAEFLLEAEDTGDSRKSNENLEYVFRQYFRKFPLHTGWQPCKLENGNSAIEYKFRIDTGIAHPDIPERNIIITGKLDFLGEKVINNRLYRAVVDDKTTGGSSKIPGTDNIDLDNEKEDYENRGQFCAYHWAARKLGINTDLTVVRRIPILSKFEPAYELDIPITNHQLFWWENSTFQMIKILVEKYKMWKESGVAPQTFFYPTFSNSCTKWSRSSTYKMGEAHNFSGRGCAYKIGCMDKNGDKVLQMQGAQVVKYPESEKDIPLEEYLRTLK